MTSPQCDLVLLSWNHLEETQPCLESLFQWTDVPSRLFIVDNGSETDVRKFLRSVQTHGAIQDVVLLQNDVNEGFPKGMNRGLRASTAPYVCLLNNDLRFTSGWLSRLLEVARAHPEIGILNPESSTFGNRPPPTMSLDAYAELLAAKRGRYVEVGMCIGFCMLISRLTLERVGFLSEEVERIFFEDEDYCMRAQAAGLRCVVAQSAYVFHGEHKTVRPSPEREALFARNQRWCHQRWGRWIRVAWPRFTPLEPGSPSLRQWLERLVSWARRRVHIYVFCPLPAGMTSAALFDSVHLVPHVDIHWQAIPHTFAEAVALGLILKRRKKPFDVIAAPDARWARFMQGLWWLHRAEVIPQENEEQLLAQWQQRARRLP